MKECGIEKRSRRVSFGPRNDRQSISGRRNSFPGFRDLSSRSSFIGGIVDPDNGVGSPRDRDPGSGSAQATGHAEEHSQKPGCESRFHLQFTYEKV